MVGLDERQDVVNMFFWLGYGFFFFYSKNLFVFYFKNIFKKFKFFYFFICFKLIFFNVLKLFY